MTERIDPVPGMDSNSVHDSDSALYLVGGDAELAAELMQALLDGLPDEMESLRAALAESDWPGLAEYAHQVRGATRYCGVPALDTAMEALERAARLGDGLRCEDCFQRVESQARRLQEAMAARAAGRAVPDVRGEDSS